MSIVENTLESLYDQLLFLSGQNSSSVPIADAVRLFNYGLNDYTHIAITADGRWKAGDSQSSGLNSFTTSLTGADHYTLQADFLAVDRVEYTANGATTVLTALDRKDLKSQDLSEQFGTGDATHYDLDGDTLTLYPNPGSGTLTIYPSLPFGHFTSTSLSQVIGIPAHHAEYLVLYALARLGLRLTDNTRIEARNELEMERKKVREYYSKRDEDTPRQLIGLVNVIE